MINAAFSRLYSVSWMGLGIVSSTVDIVSLSSSCAWYTNYRLPLSVHVKYVTRVGTCNFSRGRAVSTDRSILDGASLLVCSVLTSPRCVLRANKHSTDGALNQDTRRL